MVASLCLCCVQGEVKPALARLRESRAARARELSEEVLAVQERLDAGLEALTERTEDNAALGTQVTPLSIIHFRHFHNDQPFPRRPVSMHTLITWGVPFAIRSLSARQ